MQRIIVNADDFGRHELINRAVAQAVETGCLRSATLMPGGAAFDDAVNVARAHKHLGVGVHFTLVNGNPVLPKEEIPSLVDERGLFYDNYILFVKRFLLGKINLDEVRHELSAQMNKMRNTGLALTHVDSHQHMHSLPGIVDIVLEIIQGEGIKAMRVSKTPIFTEGMLAAGLGAVVGRIGLGSLAKMAEIKAHRAGIVTPEHFTGIVAGDAVDKNVFKGIIDNLKAGTTEVMLHPGVDNDRLQTDCLWQHDFEAELEAVTLKENLASLQAKGIEVVNFQALTES